MKKRLAGIIIAGLLVTNLGIPSSAQAPVPVIPGENTLTGATARPGMFESLPLTPINSDLEDCFNDPIPYDPVPQG